MEITNLNQDLKRIIRSSLDDNELTIEDLISIIANHFYISGKSERLKIERLYDIILAMAVFIPNKFETQNDKIYAEFLKEQLEKAKKDDALDYDYMRCNAGLEFLEKFDIKF